MLIDASVWDALLCYADLHVSSDGVNYSFEAFVTLVWVSSVLGFTCFIVVHLGSSEKEPACCLLPSFCKDITYLFTENIWLSLESFLLWQCGFFCDIAVIFAFCCRCWLSVGLGTWKHILGRWIIHSRLLVFCKKEKSANPSIVPLWNSTGYGKICSSFKSICFIILETFSACLAG